MFCRSLFVLTGWVSILLFAGCKKEDTGTYSQLPYTDVFDISIGLDGIPRDIDLTPMTRQLFVPGAHAKGYSYGTSVKLNDTSILLACVKFGEFGDFNESHIVAKRSDDNGKTWSEEFLLQQNIANVNSGAPCLLKISPQHVMLFFSAKNSFTDINVCMKESFDGGKTWGAVKRVNNSTGYHLLNNDRALYSNGRIILPMAYADDISKQFHQQIVFCYYSDDLGKSWKKSNSLRTNFALMEPTICRTGGSGLLMAIRSLKGYIYFSRSGDNGATWKNIYKSQVITPESPQALLQVNNSDTLLLVWNFNNPNGTDNHEDRDPLTIAYSTDKGDTWKKPINLQSNKQFNYFYPSINCYQNTLYLTYSVRRKRTYEPSLFYNELQLSELFK